MNRKSPENHTRELIIAAALKLVSQNGYAGTSIAKICDEAGLNASSVYWFFENKEDLFVCTIKEAAEEFLAAVRIPAHPDPASPEQVSSELIKSLARRLETNASFLRLLLIMMLEERNLPAELRSKIAQIRAGVGRFSGPRVRAPGTDDGRHLRNRLCPVLPRHDQWCVYRAAIW